MDIKEVKVSFSYKDIKYKNINKFLLKRYFGTARFYIWILVFLSFFSAASLFQETPFYEPNASDLTFTFALTVALIILIVLNSYYKNRLSRDVMNIPIRLRKQQLIVTPEGIQSSGPVFIGIISWNDVQEITGFNDMILLLISPIEYFPIPENCFPNGLSQQDVIALLSKWKGSSQS
jgi:hypothetical protein